MQYSRIWLVEPQFGTMRMPQPDEPQKTKPRSTCSTIADPPCLSTLWSLSIRKTAAAACVPLNYLRHGDGTLYHPALLSNLGACQTQRCRTKLTSYSMHPNAGTLVRQPLFIARFISNKHTRHASDAQRHCQKKHIVSCEKIRRR